MFNFLVFSVIIAVAQADIDKFLGKSVTIAISPNITKYGTGCDWYDVSKVDGAECTCGKWKNVPVITFKSDSGEDNGAFAVLEVETYGEGEEAAKIGKCHCGDEENALLALKEINDNYFVAFGAPETPNAPVTAFLTVRTLPTQANLDELVNSIPEIKNRTSDYGMFCGYN